MSTPTCAFHHHRVALTTGYMQEPCATAIQDQQLCCAHNERGSPRLRAALDLFREKSVTTEEQDHKLRLAMHHSQQRVFSCDLNTNFMVYLYLMQEGTGPVCGADRHDALTHEKRLRTVLGLSADGKFSKDGIDSYAKRAQAEASLPIRLISELVEELRPLTESNGGRSAKRKIDALLNGLPKDLFSPLIRPEESPWFQRVKL